MPSLLHTDNQTEMICLALRSLCCFSVSRGGDLGQTLRDSRAKTFFFALLRLTRQDPSHGSTFEIENTLFIYYLLKRAHKKSINHEFDGGRNVLTRYIYLTTAQYCSSIHVWRTVHTV